MTELLKKAEDGLFTIEEANWINHGGGNLIEEHQLTKYIQSFATDTATIEAIRKLRTAPLTPSLMMPASLLCSEAVGHPFAGSTLISEPS